ncbi:glycosyltransferase [Luteibacter sp. PPL552]
MRIVIDMQGAQTESRFRGIGRYSSALARAMLVEAERHDIWIVANSALRDGAAQIDDDFADLLPPDRVRRFEVPVTVDWRDPTAGWRRAAAERLRESYLRGLRPDIVHVSSLFEGSADQAVTSIGQLGVALPTAVTLYDLIPLLNGDAYLGDAWARDWYASKIESLRRADLLLAISEHARREAIDCLDLDPARVVTISSAASSIFRPTQLDAQEKIALLRRFGILRPFVMYSGAMDSRKNVAGLIAGFGALPAPVREAHDLVIAGRLDAAEQKRLTDIAAKLGVDGHLRFTGYVTDTDLIGLYGVAALYVFPSLHEGFGLPALEAMSCGVPTIGSATTSIPEVIGRDDALFDPTSPASIASCMARVLTDGAFAQVLREHAVVQSGRFSWRSSARRAIDAFEARYDRARVAARVWATVLEDVQSEHTRLIESVASIRVDVRPEHRDVVQVAAAISSNRDDVLDVERSAMRVAGALKWRVEGPFDSSYSLALVNRELALGLAARGVDVALHSTEGPGDFEPSATFLDQRPDVRRLHSRLPALSEVAVDVSSRLLYPPRVSDMRSPYNLLHAYAWEESGFPDAWVELFNDHLQGISALSTHVEKILLDAGVRVPISVSEAGVDHWERIESGHCPDLPGAGFRFLHVSSCFPRKGADVMLAAYGKAFSASDDVCLVIKTFVNPHNDIHAWLAEARRKKVDFPRVHIIEEDLDETSLKALYEACDVLVAPSRAEGFGLPMAEAMMSGLGVITTAWGGQLDFCRDDTAWLVDYRFDDARTHFGIFHSVWAEPDVDALARAMREVHGLTPAQRAIKVEKGRELLRERFTWAAVAERVEVFARGLAIARRRSPPRIGWISTWNKRCGIASYSEHLVGNMPAEIRVLAAEATQRTAADGPGVVRCWDQDGPDDLQRLASVVNAERMDALVLQFQYGFYQFDALSDFIVDQHRRGRALVVMMHATQDPEHVPDRKLSALAGALSVCDRVFVHGVADLNRLKDLGLVDNVAIFPHGIVDFPGSAPASRSTGRFVVASYGFFLPHKGLSELVEAIGVLKTQHIDVELRMINAEYPVGESRQLIEATRARIDELGLGDRITLVTDYLADADSLSRLSDADLIVFPYQGTGESSSAAVRYGLASGRPVAVTPIAIFDDVGGAVHRLPGIGVAALAEGIAALVADARSGGTERQAVEEVASRWRAAHRYSYLGRRLYNTVSHLATRRRPPGRATRPS